MIHVLMVMTIMDSAGGKTPVFEGLTAFIFSTEIQNLPFPWYWLVFAGAMISTTGILIYRKNTKVYKD